MSKIQYWKTPEHRGRFLDTIKDLGKIDPIDGVLDSEYAAAIYILTSDLGTWQRAEPYIDAKRDKIDFDEMLEKEHWSGGYSVLIYEAWNLFNGHVEEEYPVSFSSLTRLDERNQQVAVTALLIRLSRIHVSQI